MKNLLLLTLPLMLVTGCVAGPDYAGPPQAAGAFPTQFLRAGEDVDATAPRASQWWTLLGDPVLDQLEARALADNPGIAAARARIEQARARVRAERANRFPTLGADATVAQGRLPDLNLQGPPSGASSGGSGGDDSLSFYNLGAIANWELDFAGEQVRRSEAANAQAAAAVATGEDALVQLAAEVARAYVALREAQARLALLESERDLQQQTLELTYSRYTQGALALFPVGNANAELELLKARIAEARADSAVFRDTLAALVGEAPGALDDMLANGGPIPLPPERVEVGDPAALIARRPDIRAAERNLAAVTARIGVAEARRFPKISFLGVLGLGGPEPGDVLDPGNLAALALPRLQWNLLDFGRTAAAIDEARGTRDEAEARYREIVLGALRDAEQALARFAQNRAYVAALAQIKRQADTAADLNIERHSAGVISRTELNASLRQRDQSQADLNRALAGLTTSWIAVQKSLGLGWEELPPPG
ncbi:MAG: efflux transporter outer membrane subunit [Novosphingobium sp.]|jgi:multidrug efflux system outer membrane protein|nr:efflux transporter outer membrane subunit [Novosphingobium sp.]